jgi:hypothetical protein
VRRHCRDEVEDGTGEASPAHGLASQNEVALHEPSIEAPPDTQ